MLNIIKQIIDKVELRMYNEYTIENYFRKKGYMVGENNRIFVKYLGSEPYLVKIGNNCVIAEGVKFITHDGVSSILRKEIPNLHVFGKIEVKDNSFIGMDVIILPDVTIGPNSAVGAGSVVTKDVPPNTVVAGVPAKAICSLEHYKEKCIEKWKALNLKGPRETWKEQLIKYYWEDK